MYKAEDEQEIILCLMMKSEEDQEFPMHVVVTGVVRFPDSGSETVEASLSGWHVPGDWVENADDLVGATVVGARSMDAGWVAQTDQDRAMIRDRMNEVLGPKPDAPEVENESKSE